MSYSPFRYPFPFTGGRTKLRESSSQSSRARALFVADGGPGIGLGHLHRSLVLGRALREQGVDAHFLVPRGGRLAERVLRYGFSVDELRHFSFAHMCAVLEGWKTRPEIVVADSYRLEGEFFDWAKGFAVVALIDDSLNRVEHVDLVIYPGGRFGVGPPTEPRGTKQLLGPHYALVEHGVWAGDGTTRRIRKRVQRMVLTVGGTDPRRIMLSLCDRLIERMPDIQMDVIVGPFFKHGAAIAEFAAARPAIRIHNDPEDMSKLLDRTDLAVSGGGQTVYELAAAGIPTLAICLADNQEGNVRRLNEAGAIRWAGYVTDPKIAERVAEAVAEMVSDHRLRARLAAAGPRAVDGRGADRVIRELMHLLAAHHPAHRVLAPDLSATSDLRPPRPSSMRE